MVFATAAAREEGRETRLGVLFQRSDKEGRTVAAAAPHVARSFLRSILHSLLQSTGAKTMARMNAPRPRGHSRALALPRAAAAAMFARSAPLANETIMDLSRSILSRSASAVSGEQLLIRAASTVAAAAEPFLVS